jgi:hypothetical protein
MLLEQAWTPRRGQALVARIESLSYAMAGVSDEAEQGQRSLQQEGTLTPSLNPLNSP